MFKLYFLLILIVFGCGKSTTSNLKIIEGLEIDLGKVKKGAKKIGTFSLKNNGLGIIKIKKIQPSCLCTIVSEESFNILPFQTKKISYEIKFENDILLEINETIIIRSDAIPEFTIIEIKGNV